MTRNARLRVVPLCAINSSNSLSKLAIFSRSEAAWRVKMV
jgi:hypothetical protein